MQKIIYNYKGIDFELNIFDSYKKAKSKLSPAIFGFKEAYNGLSKVVNVYLNSLDYQEFQKSMKIQNSSFKPEIDKYLDYHIKYILDIIEIKNEWISNPGQICFLGEKHILKWEFRDEITNTLEYKFEISDHQITLFVSRILEKRVIKRRIVLMNFLKEQLAEIIKKIQPKYEEKLSLNPIDFEIHELIPETRCNIIACAWIRPGLIGYVPKKVFICYTISMICSHPDIIESTILHELLHCAISFEHNVIYKEGENYMKDFKLLHRFDISPNTFYKKF